MAAIVKKGVASGAVMVRQRWSGSTSFVRWDAPVDTSGAPADGLSAQLILEHQIRSLIEQKRDAPTAEISHLRQLAQGPSE